MSLRMESPCRIALVRGSSTSQMLGASAKAWRCTTAAKSFSIFARPSEYCGRIRKPQNVKLIALVIVLMGLLAVADDILKLTGIGVSRGLRIANVTDDPSVHITEEVNLAQILHKMAAGRLDSVGGSSAGIREAAKEENLTNNLGKCYRATSFEVGLYLPTHYRRKRRKRSKLPTQTSSSPGRLS
jgi:hypothetical protein